jgi:hypothetical protein
MHLSMFSTRETKAGWVIDAYKINGNVEQLLGVFTTKLGAVNWIAEHPAVWWKLHNA